MLITLGFALSTLPYVRLVEKLLPPFSWVAKIHLRKARKNSISAAIQPGKALIYALWSCAQFIYIVLATSSRLAPSRKFVFTRIVSIYACVIMRGKWNRSLRFPQESLPGCFQGYLPDMFYRVAPTARAEPAQKFPLEFECRLLHLLRPKQLIRE